MENSRANRVIVVTNPKSGSRTRADLIEQLKRELTSAGLHPEICSDLDLINSRSTELDQAGELRAVVAAGGDGTVSAVASRIPPQVPIAILPLGTENLLAKYLGLAQNPELLAKSIHALTTKCIDCGEANGKLFMVMVGIGFDAQVVYEMSRSRTGHINHWSYAGPIARSLWNYRFPKLRITIADEKAESQSWTARWAFVANLPRYAAGLPIADWAIGDDGMLDVCSFRGGGVLRSLRYFGFLMFNRHKELASFRSNQSNHIRIESDERVIYQLDGDHGGHLPLEIKVLPKRLTLIVPN